MKNEITKKPEFYSINKFQKETEVEKLPSMNLMINLYSPKKNNPKRRPEAAREL